MIPPCLVTDIHDDINYALRVMAKRRLCSIEKDIQCSTFGAIRSASSGWIAVTI
jgi:hypothetical protein